MNLDNYIQYWAQLIKKSYGDNSQLSEMSSKQNQQNPKNSKTRINPQVYISRELQRLQKSGSFNSFLLAFYGAKRTSIFLQYGNKRIQAFIEQGSRDTVGVKKIIYKHLIDGRTAWTGGFTLEELNRDLSTIVENGKLIRDHNGMHIKVNVNGLQWTIAIRRYANSKKWTISTICTNRDQDETKKMIRELNEKSSGPIAQQNRSSNRGQPNKR